jgi:glycosyltransferase involved in cell wall biosynthesis
MAIQATKLAENLRTEGFNVVVIPTNMPLPEWMRFAGNVPFVRTILRSIFLLGKISRECSRVEVFYFLTGFFDFFFWVTVPVLLLIKIRKKRVILSARGGDAGRFFKRWKAIARSVLRIPQAITVPSEFLQKQFSDHLQMSSIIVPNIADLDQFHFRERPRLSPRFIVTRHLEEMYNIACVVRAFKNISGVYPDSRLTIAGDGTQKKSLQELACSLGLSSSIAFVGRVPHQQLPALYDAHDIFLNASSVDNLPGAILEAFASGLPVVSTRAGGIPYVVEHLGNGLLVDLNDSDALAQSAIFLLKSPETAQRLARNAFKYVQDYSWGNVRNTLVPLLAAKAL